MPVHTARVTSQTHAIRTTNYLKARPASHAKMAEALAPQPRSSTRRLPDLPGQIGLGVFDVFQIPYSALQPEHGELITRAADAGAGVLVRGAVARGTASEDKNWAVQPLSSSGPPARDRWEAAKLDELLDGEMNRHEFILRFTLSHPGVSSAIVGTSNPEHLRGNVKAASRGPLPP